MSSKFYMPTRVLMGAGCVLDHQEIFKALGRKALIVSGNRSAKANGSERDVLAALQGAGVPWVIFDKVMSNPTIACAYEGAESARASGADFVIAIGGGSPMDAGKAIALLAVQDIREKDLFSGNYGSKALPMAFIPTTAGTGSEVTPYAILTNDRAKTKTSLASDLLFPQYAFLDPRYTLDLSMKTTVHTAIDALSHAVEGMLSVRATLLSNALAKESIDLILSCLPELKKGLNTGTPGIISSMTREKLLYASLLAGMTIAQTGTTAVHAMGYSLTYFRQIDHGRANGLLLAEYMRLVQAEKPELAARILKAMGFDGTDQLKDILDGLLGEKETLSEDEILQFSNLAYQTRNIANSTVKPNEITLQQLYRASMGSV